MRNPFARHAHRDDTNLTLRERLAATTARARQVLAPGHGGSHQSGSALQPDPVFAAIEGCQRLYADWTATNDLPQPAGSIDPLPEQDAAAAAFHNHRVDVLLKTVPATAAGCAALARFCVEFHEAEGFALDEDAGNDQHLRVLALIGRSPMR